MRNFRRGSETRPNYSTPMKKMNDIPAYPQVDKLGSYPRSLVLYCRPRLVARPGAGLGSPCAVRMGGGWVLMNSLRLAKVTSGQPAMPLTTTERQLAPPCDGLQWGIFRRARSCEKVRTSEVTTSSRDPIPRNALPLAFTNSRDSAQNRMVPPCRRCFRRMFFGDSSRQESPALR